MDSQQSGSDRPNAAELHRATGEPTWRCPKDGGAMWYRPIASSSAHVCEACGWLALNPARDGAVRATSAMRAVEDDPYGLWREGDIAEDLGWESDHPDAPRIRVLRLMPGGKEITPADWRSAFTPIASTGKETRDA